MPKKPDRVPKGAVATPGAKKAPKGSQPRKKKGRNAKRVEAQVAATPDPDPAVVAALQREQFLQKAEQIRALAGFGLTDTEIAFAVGIKPEELYANRDIIGEWLVEGKAKAKAKVRQSLYRQAVFGNTTAISLYEQLVHGWRPSSRVESTGKDGGPQEHEFREVMSDEDIIGRLRTLRDRAMAVVDRSAHLPPGDEVKPADD